MIIIIKKKRKRNAQVLANFQANKMSHQDIKAALNNKSGRDETEASSMMKSSSTTNNNNFKVKTPTTATSESASMKTQSKLAANLHSAATEGKVELVRLLLRCGANVNSQDEQVSSFQVEEINYEF